MNPVARPPVGALEVPARRWQWWLWLPVAFVLVVVGLWWVGHPTKLPASDAEVSVTTKVGQRVYLAAIGPEYDGRRNLEVTGVEMSVDAPDMEGVEVDTWICRGGSIAQTTDPSRFCDDVLPAKGNAFHLGGGDQMMVSVVSADAGEVGVGQLEVTFREGLQRGTLPAGASYAVEVRE